MSTSSDSRRFRTFSDTFGKGAPSFLHVADSGVVFTDQDGALTTGAWRPATPADIAGQAGFYSSVISGLQNTSIGTIPAGALSWSVTLQAGSLSLNGALITTTGYSIQGGGNGGKLSSPIPYGCTGCSAIVKYDI